jgi:hypothetical protein
MIANASIRVAALNLLSGTLEAGMIVLQALSLFVSHVNGSLHILDQGVCRRMCQIRDEARREEQSVISGAKSSETKKTSGLN